MNHNLERHKQNARDNLLSEEGEKHRGQKCTDVEVTFGIIKNKKVSDGYASRETKSRSRDRFDCFGIQFIQNKCIKPL